MRFVIPEENADESALGEAVTTLKIVEGSVADRSSVVTTRL